MCSLILILTNCAHSKLWPTHSLPNEHSSKQVSKISCWHAAVCPVRYRALMLCFPAVILLQGHCAVANNSQVAYPKTKMVVLSEVVFYLFNRKFINKTTSLQCLGQSIFKNVYFPSRLFVFLSWFQIEKAHCFILSFANKSVFSHSDWTIRNVCSIRC